MDPGVGKSWHVTGDSVNGLRGYEVEIDPGIAATEKEARKILGDLVVGHVHDEFGPTPLCVPWLLNPMTISINGEPSLADRLFEEMKDDPK